MKSILVKLVLIGLLIVLSSCSDLLMSPEENENIRPSTTIAFSVHSTSHVLIYITNYNYELVRVLIDRELSAGYHSVEWNASDDNGDGVASGIYYAYLISDNYFNIIDMILLK